MTELVADGTPVQRFEAVEAAKPNRAPLQNAASIDYMSMLQRIHNTILDVLEKIGMADPIPTVQERALDRGCFINQHGRLCFPRALVEEVIANTPKDIQFLGRDAKYDLEIGGTGRVCLKSYLNHISKVPILQNEGV